MKKTKNYSVGFYHHSNREITIKMEVRTMKFLKFVALLGLLLATILVAPAAYAQLTYTEVLPTLATSQIPNHLPQLADVDGDGDLDLALDRLYLNDGNGVFSEPSTPVSLGVHGRFGDFDGDGDPDWVRFFGGTAQLLENQGGGNFAFWINWSGSLPPEGVWNAQTGDVNGDGKEDIVMSVGHNVQIRISNGDGTFATQSIVTPGVISNSFAIVLADLDGDNDLDFGQLGWFGVRIDFFRNDGTGSFTFVSTQNTTNLRMLVAGDVDGNGTVDVLGTTTSSFVTPSLLLNDGNMGFTPATSFGAVQTGNRRTTELADADGDGDLDAIGSRVFLNDGTGVFGATTVFVSATLAVPAVGDIDGDGDLDIASLSTAGASGHVYLASGVTPPPPPGALLIGARNEIVRFDATTGAFTDQFAVIPGIESVDLNLGPNGNVYVVNSQIANQSIEELDVTTGASLGFLVPPTSVLTFNPMGMAFSADGSKAYVTNNKSSIEERDATTGALLRTFTPSLFNKVPSGTTLGPDGQLYVAVRNTKEVWRFDVASGTRNAIFSLPAGQGGAIDVEFDAAGNMYVSNSFLVSDFFGRVYRFNNSGGGAFTFAGEFATFASVPPGPSPNFGGKGFAEGIAFGPDDNLYVLDRNNNQVVRFDGTTGAFIDVFASHAGMAITERSDILFIGGGNQGGANQPPDCSLAAIANQNADASCGATISGADVTGVTDPDNDLLTITVSPTNLVLGANSVIVTADDGSGGTCSSAITVNVTDNSAPVADVATLPDATGECSVTLTAPTATDNCAGAITGSTTDPTSYSTQGTFSVTWTYDDGNGNSSTQAQNVIVADVTAPVITADLIPVAGAGDDDDDDDNGHHGKKDDHGYKFAVQCSATDNCDPNPAVGSVIKLPSLNNPSVKFKTKKHKKLEIDLKKNKVKVEGPDPQGFWSQILSVGGVAVSDGQVVKLKNQGGHKYHVKYEKDGTLKEVKGPDVTLLCTATDAAGNVGTATASPPATSDDDDDDDDQAHKLAASPGGAESLPNEFGLAQNHPNPFNPTTTISFAVPEAGVVTLAIYNMRGQLVQTLHSGPITAGNHSMVWNGKDTRGLQAASGVYVYQLKAKGFVATRKLLLTK
ncbi:MAG: FG-GAP-like repeat-containing protein [bacterium]